jgi:hypothetical protein
MVSFVNDIADNAGAYAEIARAHSMSSSARS